jgi:hypothetical protein
MLYRITNRSAGPVLLRLRSGRTIHLRAGAQTPDLEGADVHGNPRLASLIERRLIVVDEVGKAAPEKAAPAKRAPAKKAAPGGTAPGTRAAAPAANDGGAS